VALSSVAFFSSQHRAGLDPEQARETVRPANPKFIPQFPADGGQIRLIPSDARSRNARSRGTRPYIDQAAKRVFTIFETVRFGRSRIPPVLLRAYFLTLLCPPGLEAGLVAEAEVVQRTDHPDKSVAVATGTKTEILPGVRPAIHSVWWGRFRGRAEKPRQGGPPRPGVAVAFRGDESSGDRVD
jgi:hypothetical protein